MDKKDELDRLKKSMALDKNLPLRPGANNLVFGVGDPYTKILFIGEGPGYWEDQKGEPFVGQAGKLLDSLLQSIKLDRKTVYITNIVHHRPPNNRDPFPNEIDSYGKYLDGIIKLINPKVIITLGRFSMAKFISNAKISAIHGKTFDVDWNNSKFVVVPMYHPAAALRNPEIMIQIKKDFLEITEILSQVNKIQVEQMQLV